MYWNQDVTCLHAFLLMCEVNPCGTFFHFLHRLSTCSKFYDRSQRGETRSSSTVVEEKHDDVEQALFVTLEKIGFSTRQDKFLIFAAPKLFSRNIFFAKCKLKIWAHRNPQRQTSFSKNASPNSGMQQELSYGESCHIFLRVPVDPGSPAVLACRRQPLSTSPCRHATCPVVQWSIRDF